MHTFINLSSYDRDRLFNLSRKRVGSWNKLYPKIGMSRSMFFNYLSGKYPIPEEIFLNLQKIAKIKIKEYTTLNKERYLEKKIKHPIFNEKLAEILGVLNGDGHVSKINFEVCVVGSILERDYYKYLKRLFEDVLNLKFSISQQENRFRLRTYSKQLATFLNEEYGLPLGKKLGKLKIPNQILKSEKFIKSYIRGLFDTDGSFYIRRKKDAVVEIISADKFYLDEIRKSLISLGFSCGISGKNLYIYRKEVIAKFFKEIKPANTKHLKKYENYLKLRADGAIG